ncbi:helix-turn-helix domain-containing protein [Desulforhopalus sp. IMCC35007]|uniref:helix-turn-helix domain-containing protein n=1 Tax=Desulforhopalus sp. IMCC35007 TaxID=2569543 RepID=UPI0010ADABB5|nr:helix-turn-helix domain-containing protein [Desulforhopalus sp. IMCC35007]TKB07195.1 hypothetical protein FCL48_18320 [Desulforhopalus sp. IMCC35007]
MPESRKREKKATLICELIAASKMPRNQLAAASGLTNTFIKDLEQGNIINVDRRKLLRLAVTLNLDLSRIDEMLRVFDRASLASEDIDIFIESAHKRKAVTAVYPHRNFYSYELAVYAMERIPGDQVIVNDRPLVCLREPGHRIFSDRSLVDSHPLYAELLEEIGRVRRSQFETNLATNRITLYICKKCIESYLVVDGNPEEEVWRQRHVANMLDYIQRFDNFSVNFTGICSYLLFSLNQPSNEKDVQLTFCAKPGHYIPSERPGRLAGFSTKNPVILNTFQDELSSIKEMVLPELSEKNTVEQYLEELLG